MSAAAAGEALQLALWGPSNAGKTVLLTQLDLTLHDDAAWRVYSTPSSESFLQGKSDVLRLENRFPAPTPEGQVEQITYDLLHLTTGTRVEIHVEDRPGLDYQEPTAECRQRLATADGLVLLFDPRAEAPDRLTHQVSEALRRIYLDRDHRGRLDERPIAVCLSKTDTVVTSLGDFHRARDADPSFVERWVTPELQAEITRYCARHRVFPLSAAGLRLDYGLVESTVFYDEDLNPRLGAGGRPLNLLEPFLWLLEELLPSAAA